MKLSVFVVTYNQERYIQQCLDSILMQKVDFEYEIIIGEDCSTDSTPQICDKYAEKFPFIKVYHHPQNFGIVKNWEFVLNHCRGDYVAMIEGDDYWLDPLKLQKQVGWLDDNPQYVITSSNVKVLYEGHISINEVWFPRRQAGDVSIIEYISPGICHTSSVVMRNFTKNICYPKWMYMTDTYTFMYLSGFGKAYHFSDEMSIYRRHVGNNSSSDWYNGIVATMKWADQHREMQYEFPQIKEVLQKYEMNDLEYLSRIPRNCAPLGLWKYRVRYMLYHKKLFLSKFCLRTIMYLPLFLKFRNTNK